jgi:hypothetical protein
VFFIADITGILPAIEQDNRQMVEELLPLVRNGPC